MNVIRTTIDGLFILEPRVHQDDRGYFLETYRLDTLRFAGVDVSFVQDNRSSSIRGTLRGMHVQVPRFQAKLVSVIVGEIFDVAIDVRKGSPTFGQMETVMLSDQNFRQFFIPAGFAHGFQVVSDRAVVEYKCSDFYHPEDELSLLWNDPTLAIPWPVKDVLVSKKDQKGMPWAEFRKIVTR